MFKQIYPAYSNKCIQNIKENISNILKQNYLIHWNLNIVWHIEQIYSMTPNKYIVM